MNLFLFWLVCSLYAAIFVTIPEIWEHYHPRSDTAPREVSGAIVTGMIISIVPVFNILIGIAGTVYVFTVIIPSFFERAK